MTKTDKKLTENDQILDPTIESNRYFSRVFRAEISKKIVIFSLSFHPGAPEPEPRPNKKVSEAENGARELKKLAPSP